MTVRCVRWTTLGLAIAGGVGGVGRDGFRVSPRRRSPKPSGRSARTSRPRIQARRSSFNFAGSSTLARQIIEGAPADVFASADEENMKKVVDAGDVAGAPQPFVRNRLAIIVPHGQPEAREEPRRPRRAPAWSSRSPRPAVPVGHYAAEAFGKAGVPVPNASKEADVKAVVTRVSMGEADAGVVYVTDVAAGGDKVEAVAIPDAHNVTAQLSHRDAQGRAQRGGRARLRRLRAVAARAARARRAPASSRREPRRGGRPSRSPRPLVAALGAALFILPLVGLLWRAPWGDLGARARSSPKRSWRCGSRWCARSPPPRCPSCSGLPLAWVQARGRFPGRSLLRALTLLPVVLPPVVGGVALLSVFGRRGLIGQWLDPLGIRLPFTTAGAILAETFVAMPFFVLAMEGVLSNLDRRLEDAARTLGATRWTVFRRVTVPLVRPSVAAGAALAWARALGEFGATITFAGNFPGRTQTIPLAVYIELESRPEAGMALSLVLLAVSLTILVVMRGRWLEQP